MAVTQTTLTAAETISYMKVGGQSDNAIDRKEEAQAILKFANIKLDLFMKTKKGNTEELEMILKEASEADKYMTSGAGDVSDEDLNAYKAAKENSTLGIMIKGIPDLLKAISDAGKKMQNIVNAFK